MPRWHSDRPPPYAVNPSSAEMALVPVVAIFDRDLVPGTALVHWQATLRVRPTARYEAYRILAALLAIDGVCGWRLLQRSTGRAIRVWGRAYSARSGPHIGPSTLARRSHGLQHRIWGSLPSGRTVQRACR